MYFTISTVVPFIQKFIDMICGYLSRLTDGSDFGYSVVTFIALFIFFVCLPLDSQKYNTVTPV